MPHVALPTSPTADTAARAPTRRVDVAIVGGGMCGSALAAVLHKAGIDLALIDMHAEHPPEFKAEKLAGDQIGLLQRLGLFDRITAGATPVAEILSVRRGRAIDRVLGAEYGLAYRDMVTAVRACLPAGAGPVIARVADVKAGPELQTVVLSDGRTIEARLLVLATGTGGVLLQKLGIERRVVRDAHSLSIAFDIEPAGGGEFRFGGLTCYGERVADRIDYVSFFPIGRKMRANLFCYRDMREAWTRDFIERPG
jgi:2-polyprenyl-6-methoxyphenol hydroxylase-like FAD-dependent oxidoreductase